MEVTNIGLFFYAFLFASVDVRAYLNLLSPGRKLHFWGLLLQHEVVLCAHTASALSMCG